MRNSFLALVGLLAGLMSDPAKSVADPLETARSDMQKALSDAKEQNLGRVEMSHKGVPLPELVRVLATSSKYRAASGHALPGAKAGHLAQAFCGYRSEKFAELLVESNAGKFAIPAGGAKEQATVTGEPAKRVELRLPTCLVAPTIVTHLIAPTETAQTLAKTYQDQENVTDDFCQMLLAMNARDICLDSVNKKLQIGDPVRVMSKDLTKKLEALQLDAIQTLRIAPDVDVDAFANSLLGATATPDQLRIMPQVNAELIIPLQDEVCLGSGRPPFDSKAVVEALLRPIVLDKNKKNLFLNRGMFWDPNSTKVRVGVVDTGVFEAARRRLREESGRELFAGNAKGSYSKTISASGPSEGIEPSPTDGYKYHGTHVLGLVLGGADFWKFLAKAKGNASVFVDTNTVAYVFDYLPQIVFIKVTSLPAFQEAPVIAADAMQNALVDIRPNVHIINFSHKAAHSEVFKKVFLDTIAAKKLVVSSAGNDSDDQHFLDDQINAQTPLLAAMLTSNKELFFVTVGAANRDLTAPAPFSHRSPRVVDLFAPGICVDSLGGGASGSDYVPFSGTSQAAPLVTFALSLLQYLTMPSDEAKFRILDTVDYAKGFEGKAISEGVLNIPKALEFFDDIVVLRKDNDQLPRSYFRGQLVAVVDGLERDDGRPCLVPEGSKNKAEESTLRTARRIVVNEAKKVRIVPRGLGRYDYVECTLNPELTLRLKNSALPGDFNFKLADVWEIIPRPKWVPPPKQ
jgi:hypothetical protein